MKDIKELNAKDLANIVKNYTNANRDTGGNYTLAEVKLRQKELLSSPYDIVAVAKKILEQAKLSEDGLTTYGELWKAFNPDKKWRGNADQKIMSNTLGRVIAYCVGHGLPILSTLVVQQGNRKLSDGAISHIFNEAKELGVDTGLDAKEFVELQRIEAKRLTVFPVEI